MRGWRFYARLALMFIALPCLASPIATSPYPSLEASPEVSSDILTILNEQSVHPLFMLQTSGADSNEKDSALISVNPLAVGTELPASATALSHEKWGLLARPVSLSRPNSIRRLILLHPSLYPGITRLFPKAQILTSAHLTLSLDSLHSGAVDGIICTETTANLLTHFTEFSGFRFSSYPGLHAIIFMDVADPRQAGVLRKALDRNPAIIYRSIYENGQLRTLTAALSSQRHTSILLFSAILLFATIIFTFTLTYLIRSRREINRELGNAVKFWESLIQNIPTPTLVLSPDGTITHVNRALLQALNSSETELKGKMLPDFSNQYQFDPPLDTRLIVSAITHPQHVMQESSLRIDGETLDLFRWLNVVLDIALTPRAIVIGWIDISQRRQLEKELAEALKTASRISEEKSRFLAHMSHELRSPLNVISGVLDNLIQGPDVSNPLLSIATNAANQLLDTVGHILDLSKIEAGELHLHPQRLLLDQFIKEIADNYRFLASQKALVFSADFSAIQDTYYLVDRTRLSHILNNLLSNAIKYTLQGSVSLTVSVTHKDAGKNTLQIVVKDTGIGIATDDLPLIIEPYVQLDDDMPQSTGLGLSITHQLVRLMGGKLHVSSTKGVGSEFIIELTLTTTDAPISQPDFVKKVTHRHILAVDDSPANLTVISLQLARLGHTVVTASNGKEALALFKENKDINVIITDCQMHIMDGYSLAHTIRQCEACSGYHIPILGVTANAFSDEETKCLTAGMDTILIKPFKTPVLETVLDRLELYHHIDLTEVNALACSPENFRQLLHVMLQGTIKDIAVARQAQNDIEAFKAILHKIKGTYALADFHIGVQLCEEAEQNLENGLNPPLALLRLERANYHFCGLLTRQVSGLKS